MAIDYGREFYSRLTKRQQGVLEAIVEIYLERKAPVSYKEVAEKIGTSKWTSYDIIQELYKKGFLKIYYKSKEGPGRTEVLYIPKGAAIERIKEFDPAKSLIFVRRYINGQLKKFENFSLENLINSVSIKIEKEKNPITTVLYTITLLVAISRFTKGDLESFIDLKFLLSQNIYSPVLLSFLVELFFANFSDFEIANNSGLDAKEHFNVVMKKFRENIYLLSPSSQKKLVEYLQNIL
jgi:DNA-binding Lrp family transcriptional regulator